MARPGPFTRTQTTMKKNLLSILLAAAVLTVPFYGCAEPPQEELETAEAALATADAAEADLYVADLFDAARDSFAAAQAEIEAQNAKSTFARSYDRAESQLSYVQQTATEAQAQVEARKATLRTDNEALFQQVEQALARAQELVAQAPRGKDGAIALASIQEDTGSAAQGLNEARAAQASGNYAEAKDRAQAALEQANSLISELEAAIAQAQPVPGSRS